MSQKPTGRCVRSLFYQIAIKSGGIPESFNKIFETGKEQRREYQAPGLLWQSLLVLGQLLVLVQVEQSA